MKKSDSEGLGLLTRNLRNLTVRFRLDVGRRSIVDERVLIYGRSRSGDRINRGPIPTCIHRRYRWGVFITRVTIVPEIGGSRDYIRRVLVSEGERAPSGFLRIDSRRRRPRDSNESSTERRSLLQSRLHITVPRSISLSPLFSHWKLRIGKKGLSSQRS